MSLINVNIPSLLIFFDLLLLNSRLPLRCGLVSETRLILRLPGRLLAVIIGNVEILVNV